MKRAIVTGLLIFCCFLLQSSVLNHFAFGGIVPNLLVIFTASCGFMQGERQGMLAGFFTGLLVDVFTVYGEEVGNGDLLGYYALLYLMIGYWNGKCHRLFYPEDIKLPLLMICSSDLAFNFVCYVIGFFFRARLDFPYYALHIILPEAVYTVLLAFVAYPFFLFLNRKLAGKRAEEKQ